jgi:hypothetical protein
VAELTLPSVKAPVKATIRNPLARHVENSLASQARMFSDPWVDSKTAQLVLGGVSYSTLRRWIALGLLSATRFSKNGHYHFRVSALEAFAKGENHGQV